MSEIDIDIDKSRVVSDQDLFDQIALHLFTQGRRAINEAGLCCYRDAKGRSCAVGCRIPDEEYSEDLETWAVWVVEVRVAAAIPDAQLYLTNELRKVHDLFENWETTEDMKGVLRAVAHEFKLSPAVLDTLAFSDR